MFSYYYILKVAFAINEGFNIKLTIKPNTPIIDKESKKAVTIFNIMSINLKSDNLLEKILVNTNKIVFVFVFLFLFVCVFVCVILFIFMLLIIHQR